MTQDYQLETILAHAGINSDEATGALASPIHFSTCLLYTSSKEGS